MVENTIEAVRGEAPSTTVNRTIIMLVGDSLNDTLRLFKERREDLLRNIYPISLDASEHVRRSLEPRICMKCGRKFLIPSQELRNFLARLGVGVFGGGRKALP